MRHFEHLSAAERGRLFHQSPAPFDAGSPREVLALALGATLYIPGDRTDLAAAVLRCAARGVTSMVVCLEDAIADGAVESSLANVLAQLRALAAAAGPVPMVFVRVREPGQLARVVEGLGDAAGVLSGFVLPKFTATTGAAFLTALVAVNAELERGGGRRLLAMPVLESPEVIHRETRAAALAAVAGLLDAHRDLVLCVRTGVTDLCGAYGLRRDRDLTVYDVRVVADVLADVVNVLGRTDGSGFVLAGPVWEYFAGHERLFKPRLRATPFETRDAAPLRGELLLRDLDGLIREVALDKANGLSGKTVIHPSHVAAVHALSVVTHEEFCDATDVLGIHAGGVLRSEYRNKMNEARPHRAWAERVVARAHVFGVSCPDVTFVDLLAAGAPA